MSGYHVEVTGKKPFGSIDGQDYCIWSYTLSADVPLRFTAEVGLGFPVGLDIKNPSAYPDVAEIQGTFLDRAADASGQRVYTEVPEADTNLVEISLSILAPSAENSQTRLSLQTKLPNDPKWTSLIFDDGQQGHVPALLQNLRGPALGDQTSPTPVTEPIVKPGILPYASELFGVYQPLLGWRSALAQSRLSDATANRFRAAARLIADGSNAANNPIAKLQSRAALNRTGVEIGQQLAAHVSDLRSSGAGSLEWASLLTASQGSALSSITETVISGLQNGGAALPGTGPARVPATLALTSALPVPAVVAAPQIAQEAATATLLHYLGQNAPGVVTQLFRPAAVPWQRALAGAMFFTDNHPAKAAFLSPIGILHSFREYFFELGTFLGPPVGHVWLSPGGTVELVEVNTRRTLVEQTIEQSTQTVQKSELDQTDQDELSDAVKLENANDTKFGVTATASGGVAGVWQASGTASFNLDSSRKQAQEQTHKRMREQSSKLSSEVRQNYKTTFRTVTETTDTSSRRYVLQNTSDRLVSYELSRKMRKVAVQVQDLGQQLCWQLYVDNPGDTLGLGEFVHNTSSALDPGVKQPDKIPYPAPQDKTFSQSIPFILYQGADDGAEDSYVRSSDNADHGIFSPDVGKDDIIQFKFDFQAPPAPDGYVLSRIRTIDFHGAQVELTTDGLGTNPDPGTGRFSFCLTHANFGGAHALPFDATLVYDVTQKAKDDVDAANNKAQKTYNDDVALAREQKFFETLRLRLKLTGKVVPRPQDDLREEERNITYRHIITRLYGSEKGWTTDDYHVASEMIRYLFDVDSMLYFVAPDWWRPRAQMLVSKNNQGEIQPTIIADSALSNRVSFGRVPALGTYRPNYLITEETTPAPQGASLGWLIQLDGDVHRNAFLNSPWVKAVLPIRPGRERDAIAWLRRPEVADTDGLNEPYAFDPAQDPPDYQGLTIEQVLLKIADNIAQEYQASLTPVPVDPTGVNPAMALPTETVFSHGFDPLDGGIKFGAEPFVVFSQWVEILPTDQVVATEYSLKGL